MSDESDKKGASAFQDAAQEPTPGFFKEFFCFLREQKKWWITPIILVIVLFGVLLALAGSGAAPFIYTLF